MKIHLERLTGVGLRGNMKTLEIIIGKDKLKECYTSDSDNIRDFIKSELSEYLPQEKIEQLEKSIIEEGSIEYYKKEKSRSIISSRSIVEELCSNVNEKRKNKPVDLAEALSSYVVLGVDESKNIKSFDNLYNVSQSMLKEMEIIIGRENIQEYYDNGKIEDLRYFFEQNLSKEEYVELQTGKNSHKLLMKLCKNIGQENLADVLKNVEENNNVYLDFNYDEGNLICNYSHNGFSLHKHPIKREQLLQMDYETLKVYLDERAIEERNKSNEIRY